MTTEDENDHKEPENSTPYAGIGVEHWDIPDPETAISKAIESIAKENPDAAEFLNRLLRKHKFAGVINCLERLDKAIKNGETYYFSFQEQGVVNDIVEEKMHKRFSRRDFFKAAVLSGLGLGVGAHAAYRSAKRNEENNRKDPTDAVIEIPISNTDKPLKFQLLVDNENLRVAGEVTEMLSGVLLIAHGVSRAIEHDKKPRSSSRSTEVNAKQVVAVNQTLQRLAPVIERVLQVYNEKMFPPDEKQQSGPARG